LKKKLVKLAGISWIFAKNRRKIGENPSEMVTAREVGPLEKLFCFEVGKVRDGWLLLGGFKHGWIMFHFRFQI